MTETMSAEEYRRQFVDPALREEAEDEAFLKKVAGTNSRAKKPSNKPTPKLTGDSEHQIQARILERLGFLKDGFFWRENSGMVKQQDAYGKVRMWRAGIKGIADIVGVYKGRFVAIEVKAQGKKPSAFQIAYLERVKQCGGIAFVCDDDTQVVQMLEKEAGEEKDLVL